MVGGLSAQRSPMMSRARVVPPLAGWLARSLNGPNRGFNFSILHCARGAAAAMAKAEHRQRMNRLLRRIR